MPPLTTIPRQPSGQLGTIQSITPTGKPDVSVGRAQQQAGAMGVQAAQIAASSANTHSQIGAALHAQGMELLKPLQELQKSKEVIAANDIVIRSLLEVRQKAAAIQTGQEPYEQHLNLISTEFDKSEQTALKEAGVLSPAAYEHVQRALGGERLRLFGEVQQDTIRREVDDQLVKLDRMDTFVRQQISQTTDPATRLQLMDHYNQSYDAAVASGVIRGTDAQTKRDDFSKYVVTDTALTIGKTQGYFEAQKYLESQQILGKDEQRVALGKVEDNLRYETQAKADAEKAAEKQLKTQQAYTASIIRNRVLLEDTTVEKLNLLASSLPTLVAHGSIDDSDVSTLQHDIAKRVDELNSPQSKRSDEQALSDITAMLTVNPESFTEAQITTYPGIISTDAQRLVEFKRSTHSANHYTKRKAYEGHVRMIAAIDEDQDIMAMISGDDLPKFKLEVQRAIEGYRRTIEAQFITQGNSISEQDIQKYDGYVESLIKRIIEKQRPASAGSPSLNDFR